MTKHLQPGPGQGGFELPEATNPIQDIVLTYAPMELGYGICEGDATDISRYLEYYVKAIKEVGRGRSNDIGFGALYVDSQPVREVARQHQDNPDRKEVQETVVKSRAKHFKMASAYLVNRAQLREAEAQKWLTKGLFNQEDTMKMPLVEDVYMLEGKWFGAPNQPADVQKDKAREELYKFHKRNTVQVPRTRRKPKAA